LEFSKQQAIDYLTGSLSAEETSQFESLLESDASAKEFVARISDDWSSLALLAKQHPLGNDLRQRTLLLTQEPSDLTEFLECPELNQLRSNYSPFQDRYQGGDCLADTNDIGNTKTKDILFRSYENLLQLLPLVTGNSPAAFGDFSSLCKLADRYFSPIEKLGEVYSSFLPNEDFVEQSIQRALLASLPSLHHFLERAQAGKIALSDVRRIFYLCRDQLKIMRASFRDLDPQKLAEDELLRVHGTHLLRQKWTGAHHAYFSSSSQASCGNFFEGPISERCVEFAEYDSNLYCLANLVASRSSSGGFSLELIKDAIPGCALAIVHADMNSQKDEELSAIAAKSPTSLPAPLAKDACLWSLLQNSMSRGFKDHSVKNLREASFFGKRRVGNKSYLWFAWPEIENIQEGAVASTEKPGQ